MTVPLGERGAISLLVGLSLSQIGKRTDHAWWHWHALDENEYIYAATEQENQ